MHHDLKPIFASAAIEDGKVKIGSSDGSVRCIRFTDGIKSG
jgi:hypothetical protein